MDLLIHNYPTKETLKEKVQLQGYVPERTEIRNIGSESYLITYFSGIHANEYTIAEICNNRVNGKVQLFTNGILELSWNMNDKKYVGNVVVYSCGAFLYAVPWKVLEDGINMHIVYNTNQSSSVLQVIDEECNEVIYFGQYNIDTFVREGYGMEIDPQTGRPKHVGIFRDNKIYHILQEFTTDHEMIEYKNGDECNIDLINRHPIYIGGFIQNKNGTFSRFGDGYEYSPITGMMIESSSITDTSSNSISINNYTIPYYNSIKFTEYSLIMMLLCNSVNQFKGNYDSKSIPIDTTDFSYEDTLYRNFDYSNLPVITSISITCKNDNSVFGRSYASNSNSDSSPLLFHSLLRLSSITLLLTPSPQYISINNCPSLKELSLSINTTPYSSFYLKNCHSLRKLILPEGTLMNAKEFVIDNCSKLEKISIGENCLISFSIFRLRNLPLLTSLSLNENSCRGLATEKKINERPFYYKNSCEFYNLISLSSITMTKATQANNRNNNTGMFGCNNNGVFACNNNGVFACNNNGFGGPQNVPNDISYIPFSRVGTVLIEKLPILENCDLKEQSFQDVFVLHYKYATLLPDYIIDHSNFDNITHNFIVCY